MDFSASSPCPYPREICLNFSYVMPFLAAKLFISIRGSAPGERIKIKGLSCRASTNANSRLNAGGYIYYSDIS